jgi:DNA-binding NarL/FixJ family response regulator
MSQAEAAIELGVSEATICRTIQGIIERSKHCSPIRIMFPILTKRQYEIYRCVVECGMTNEQTAEILKIPATSVGSTLTAIRKKGMNVPKRRHVETYYDDSMADQINFKM